MEENASPIVEPQAPTPNPITDWLNDNRERLEALKSEVDQLIRANYTDARVVHLGPMISGLGGLGI